MNQPTPDPSQESAAGRTSNSQHRTSNIEHRTPNIELPICEFPSWEGLGVGSNTGCPPREGTRPTRFPPKSACIAGPVPASGGFFNGLSAVGYFLAKSSQVARILGRDLFLPLPTLHEWGEDRGEGNPTSLLSPALSSMRWRRGDSLGAHFDTATAGPRTVPVRSSIAGVKTLKFSRPPRPRDVLRAGTARAPVAVSRCAGSSGSGCTSLDVRCSMLDVRCFGFGRAYLGTSRPASQGVLAATSFGARNLFRLNACWSRDAKSLQPFCAVRGVLAVIAILAAALAPSFVRQMDKTAGDQESATLKSFGDALQSSIMRSRYIPSATDWASRVATELGVDTTAVTDSARRQQRFFLIDPNLTIAGAGLPYTQTSAGSASKPVSPRVMILSSVGTALPAGVVNGTTTAANFTSIWNAADGTVPTAAPAFAGWNGAGNDLKIQRVDLSPLFIELQLSQLVSARCCPRYSIDANNWTNAIQVSDVITDWPGYFIQNSVLYLYNDPSQPNPGGGYLDSQQILIITWIDTMIGRRQVSLLQPPHRILRPSMRRPP